MNIVFTCGGTGGHIYPAIAVARLFQQRQPGCSILFIGAEDGMENKIVPREGFRLETLKISNFQRKLTPAAIAHNLQTAAHLSESRRKVRRILTGFCPDIVIGTGGYASFPALREGARLSIPTMVHESNAVPGLTTRMVEKYMDRIMVSFEDSRASYHDPEKVVVTGTPVREEFLYTRRQAAREKLGLDERPFVVSCWGSLGAREMNKMIAEFMRCEQEAGEPFQHLHATGSFGWRWMPEYVKDLGVDLEKHPSIDMREYIFNMPTCMAAADLIISRAGANAICEISALAKPNILIPLSANASRGDQILNARSFERQGYSKVLEEESVNAQTLLSAIREVYENRQTYINAMKKSSHTDSIGRILSLIQECERK